MAESLIDWCAEKIAGDRRLINANAAFFEPSPTHLKDKIRRLALKRGYNLEASVLASLLHGKVRQVDLSDTSEVTAEHIEIVASKSGFGLKSLNLNYAGDLTNLKSRTFSQFRNLHDLHLRKCALPPKSYNEISETCSNLEELDLGLCGEAVNDEVVKAISTGCPRLKCLNLSSTSCGDLGLASLPVTLKELRVDCCHNVTDSGIESILSRCKAIQHLYFHNCDKVTDRSREALVEFLIETQYAMKQVYWTVN